jgi:hypothetical protein
MKERRCPDCDVALLPIKLIDQLGGASARIGLSFTTGADPKFSAWSGGVKNQDGTAQGFLCPQCDRVLLYAQRT